MLVRFHYKLYFIEMNSPKATKRSSTRGCRRGNARYTRAENVSFNVQDLLVAPTTTNLQSVQQLIREHQSTPATQIPTLSQPTASLAASPQSSTSTSFQLSSTPVSSSSSAPRSSSSASLDYEAIRSILLAQRQPKLNKRPYKKTSIVWLHSTVSRNENDSILACNYCERKFAFCGSTTNTKNHLKKEHNFLMESSDEEEEEIENSEPKTV